MTTLSKRCNHNDDHRGDQQCGKQSAAATHPGPAPCLRVMCEHWRDPLLMRI